MMGSPLNFIFTIIDCIICGGTGVGGIHISTDFFTKILGDELYLINNAIAWVVGVIFAFVTNKLFVFESKSWNVKIAGKELTEFVGARLFSFGVEEGGMWLFVDILAFGEKSLTLFGITITGQIIAKLVLAVIVVILNYFFSKFIIFKKNKNQGDS